MGNVSWSGTEETGVQWSVKLTQASRGQRLKPSRLA
jgi:hypothetical protein